jgi:S-adenosylmethionine:tRNA ribosyltransferase-isomerase
MNESDPDLLSAWQFDLPSDLIADRPAPRRDDARLLIVDRQWQQIRHSHVRLLPQLLQRGDLLVFNNTKVLPARLFGIRTATGGRWEGLYVEQTSDGDWVLMCDTAESCSPVKPSQSSRPHGGPNNRCGPPFLLAKPAAASC